MENKYFTQDMLEVLTSPQNWRIVSSSLPSEVEAVEDIGHQEWMKSHADSHSHREIMIPMRGRINQGFMGKVYPAVPGVVFLMDSFEEHDSYYPEWTSDISHLWFYITQDGIRFHEACSREGILDLDKSGGWLTMTEQLAVPLHHLFFDPRKTELPVHVLRFRALSALVSLVSSAIEFGYKDQEKESRESFQERVILTIQKHIQQSAGRGVSISSLSLLSGYSKFHLQRLFKHYTGRSIHQYIDECRIARLRQMENAGYRKKEIASVLGFEHQSSFARWSKGR